MEKEKPQGGPLEAERRLHVRNNVIVCVALVALALLVAGLITLLTLAGGGPKVPDVRGMSYDAARKKVEGAGFSIEIDPNQDSSGECGRLKVENQDPKPGTRAEKNETVTVRLKGLHESAKLVRELSNRSSAQESAPAGGGQAEAEAQQQAQPQPARSGHTVCLDPGHSNRTGSEIDQATGLNVGDNTGAPGEPQAMWELAQKTRSKLEQAGYTVRLTKPSADSYVSLRQRADTGNTCEITVRLHYDDTGFTGVMRPPANAARCPVSDPSRITVVPPEVASGSDRLASCLAAALGLPVRDDTGGTSQGNTTPAGHPTALIGSVLSRVPVACIENRASLVRGNASGQDEVARQILAGINAYFGR